MGHWLVIDLEATTDEGGWAMEEMEIIEIGASLVGVDGHERDHFQRIVKPQRRPCLTDFCRELTHISQTDVDNAAPLPQVWAQFERWLMQHASRLVGWSSWGIMIDANWNKSGASTACIACWPMCHTSISSRLSPRLASYSAR